MYGIVKYAVASPVMVLVCPPFFCYFCSYHFFFLFQKKRKITTGMCNCKRGCGLGIPSLRQYRLTILINNSFWRNRVSSKKVQLTRIFKPMVCPKCPKIPIFLPGQRNQGNLSYILSAREFIKPSNLKK